MQIRGHEFTVTDQQSINVFKIQSSIFPIKSHIICEILIDSLFFSLHVRIWKCLAHSLLGDSPQKCWSAECWPLAEQEGVLASPPLAWGCAWTHQPGTFRPGLPHVGQTPGWLSECFIHLTPDSI